MVLRAPWGRGRLRLLVVVGLLLATGVSAPIISAAAGEQAQPEADNTVTRIAVYENGSARWTIQVRTRLDTPDRVEDYEAFQSQFEANESRYLDPFRARMQRVVNASAAATDREMDAVDFSISTRIQEVPRRWGIVSFEFVWTDFAVQRNGTLVMGDVFEGGFFLAANDTLVVEAPEGYEISGVRPAPSSRERSSVSWTGRQDFPDRQPRVEIAQTAGGEQNGSPTRTPETPGEVLTPAVGLGAVVLIVVVAVVGYGVYRRRQGGDRSVDGSRDRPVESSEDVPMTDEERVIDLLESRGGRLRQSALAEELDWSASKTSRVIGRMVEAGSVKKLQIGRENLVDLVGDDD